MRFANGMINVVISHTPPKFLRIMNFLGYKGTETIGLNEMNRVAFDLNAGYWTKMAQLTLIYYWVYGKPHGENVPDDLSLCKKLIEAELQMFPQVCFLFLFDFHLNLIKVLPSFYYHRYDATKITS